MAFEHKNGGPTLSLAEPAEWAEPEERAEPAGGPGRGATPQPEQDKPLAPSHSAASTVGQLTHGLRRLWPLVQPLSAEAVIGCHDRETTYPETGVSPPRPHWFIHDRTAAEPTHDQALDVVDPWYIDPVVEPVQRLSVETVRSWLERAQAQPAPDPDTYEVGWTELWFNATRVRVPHPCAPDVPANVALEAAEVRWVATVPCARREGAAWVAGPTREMRRIGIRAPMTLHASNYGQVEISVSANWSIWSAEGTPGRAALVDAARSLVADGWSVRYGAEFFHELA
ncbi:hypothetical protein [Streptomyces sp. MAR4 CNX-425]|uniref:hypothetical protein n=1 Tax=Streptomyces sp. MAR4 CNX-425 TaxID=3406343 RepID=UPI003B50FD42